MVLNEDKCKCLKAKTSNHQTLSNHSNLTIMNVSLFTPDDHHRINFTGFPGGKISGEKGGYDGENDSYDVIYQIVIDRVGLNGW